MGSNRSTHSRRGCRPLVQTAARLSYSLGRFAAAGTREGLGHMHPLNPSRQPLTAENQTKMARQAEAAPRMRRGQRRKFLHTSEFALT